MSYTFSIDGLKKSINKYLYWFIYIFSEKLIWLSLIIIFTLVSSLLVVNNNPSFLFEHFIKGYVYIPLIYCMLISVGVMAPIVICCEILPYYFHINNYTNNCRANKIKLKNKIELFTGQDVNNVIKKNIIDIYNLYLDITQNRKKRKEDCLILKKRLCLDYLGPRQVKIISEIKSVSKRYIIFVERIEETYEDRGAIHAFETIYSIKNGNLNLKKINYIGGRSY